MARGLTDLPEEPAQEPEDINEETRQVIHDLIVGQNKLHDRIIDLERKLDHVIAVFPETAAPKRIWKRGL